MQATKYLEKGQHPEIRGTEGEVDRGLEERCHQASCPVERHGNLTHQSFGELHGEATDKLKLKGI